MSIVEKVRKKKVLKKRIKKKVVKKTRPVVRENPKVIAPPPSVIGIIDDVIEADKEVVRFFRPSMFHGCPRANVFHHVMAPRHPQRITNRLRRILDNGSAVHEWVQEHYLSRHLKYWFIKEPKVLAKINGAYVRGSCDGVFIRRSDGYRFGIEFKTIGHTYFERLTKPKPEHVLQARIYMRLQKLDYIVIVYWDKDKQFLKEFPVKADDAEWKKITQRVKKFKGYADKYDAAKNDRDRAKALPVYNRKVCDPDFCTYTDYCKKMGAPLP